jgi:hypothetical protein
MNFLQNKMLSRALGICYLSHLCFSHIVKYDGISSYYTFCSQVGKTKQTTCHTPSPISVYDVGLVEQCPDKQQSPEMTYIKGHCSKYPFYVCVGNRPLALIRRQRQCSLMFCMMFIDLLSDGWFLTGSKYLEYNSRIRSWMMKQYSTTINWIIIN